MSDRITREVTPFVEVLKDPAGRKPRLLRSADYGEIVEEDGRAVLRVVTPGGKETQRLLLDPDGLLWQSLLASPVDWLERAFEVHLEAAPKGPVEALAGRTWVLPEASAGLRLDGGQNAVVIAVPASGAPPPTLSEHVSEVHFRLEPGALPPSVRVPAIGCLDFARPEVVDELPTLLHAMGSGRVGLREVRIRVEPLHYHGRGRRPPFLSEVIDAVASAIGVPAQQLTRELAFRTRLSDLGIRRHLVPEPFFTTFTFRGHRTRGLVPATTLFSLPKRGSRRDVLRGTPESEHDRLVDYLGLLEDPTPRLTALAARGLFAVSIHVLPNPDVPITPNHGGIARWVHGEIVALT
jgi:hypothetical protein